MMIGSQSSEAEVAASSLLGNLSPVDSPYPRARPRPRRRQADRCSWLCDASASPDKAVGHGRGRMKFWSTARLNRNKFCQGVATRVGFQPWVADTVNKKILDSVVAAHVSTSLFCASVPMPRWRPCCPLIRARIGISGSVAKLMAWKMWRRMRGSATGQRELGTNTVGKGQRNFGSVFRSLCVRV